jgi:glycosyltransferase involved in cell wall biosynthesis
VDENVWIKQIYYSDERDELRMVAETNDGPSVAVIIPCKNEESSIGLVVSRFSQVMPDAKIFVIDNGSTDQTAHVAANGGAIVIREDRPGKGWAVRRGFASIEADYYFMIDGDDTYEVEIAPAMLEKIANNFGDMVVATRISDKNETKNNYRAGHVLGNRFLTWLFSALFDLKIDDCLSGYRLFSKRFVKTFVLDSTKFEVETDLNVHASQLGISVFSLESRYESRLAGSESKLNTYRDGSRILRRNLQLAHIAKPSVTFGLLSLPWFGISVILFLNVLENYFEIKAIPNFPSLIVSVSALVVGFILLSSGLIAELISRTRKEQSRHSFLAFGKSQSRV